MDPGRWPLIKAAFQGALQQPAAVRESWLVQACLNHTDVLREVRTLLMAAEMTGGFLDSTRSTSDSVHHANECDAATCRDRSGEMLGHYQLIRRLGTGGMGQVFLARDLALGREAAIKVLRQFDQPLRLRLLREAEASARLQHPAIATFFEAGVVNGEAFIAMEFVPGLTLRARLVQGPLPVDEALAITRCLLEALGHAHAAGLLHRDIKPENIIVTGPKSAKLLDFGIAKHLVSALPAREDTYVASEEAQTQPVGTLGYMAPEQILGDLVDVRTDIFQVAVVLYEMLTGEAACGGGSVFERLFTVLTEGPDLRTLERDGSPPGLIAILARALARDPASRPDSAATFLRDLQDLAGESIVTELPAIIAVADLENLTGDADLEWLGTAIAERLRPPFMRLTAKRILSRDALVDARATLTRARAAADAVSVAQQLGCNLSVAGTVQRYGAGFQARVQVVDVPTRRVVAVKEAASSVDGLLEFEDELVRAVASVLGADSDASHSQSGRVIDAQKCYARACLLRDGLARGSLEQARDLLERAVEIDPDHADALAALASTYALSTIATTNFMDIESALVCANRALAIDPQHAKARMWQGYAFFRCELWTEAIRAYRHAIELDPTDAQAHYFCGASLMFCGRGQEALAFAQRAVQLESASGLWWLALGSCHMGLGHLEEAAYCFARARSLETPDARHPTAGAAAYLGEVLRRQGRLQEGRKEALAAVETAEHSDHAYREAFRAHALLVLGRTALDADHSGAASAAFRQVLAQLRGRPRTRACGHFAVQALAGLARATAESDAYDEARRLFDARAVYNFEPFFGATDNATLAELALAAQAVHRFDDAREFLSRADSVRSVS